MTAKRIFISTGEVSGDWHGAELCKALVAEAQQRGISLEIWALGGDRMAQAGAKLLGNTAGIGSVGAVEALQFILPTIRLQEQAKKLLRQYPPDLVVLIDYMMPNLGMGNFAKQELCVPVVYYIAPQEWVWSLNDQNTKAIAKFTDKLFAIFAREAEYYRSQGAVVEWVGHPFVDSLSHIPDRTVARQKLGIGETDRVIALLPVSRRQELTSVVPIVLQSAKILQQRMPDLQFWLPLARPQYRQPIAATAQRFNIDIVITDQPSQWVIRSADLVIGKSGTANLETAILGVPQVVVYRITPLTAWIAKHLMKVKIPFASPVNLVVMRAIVPELLQDDATPTKIADTAWQILTDRSMRQQMLAGYQEVMAQLGTAGAIARVARGILDLIP
jgi:lipid-A-disaccharide synthase